MKFLSVLLFHFAILVHSAPQGEKKVTWFDEDNEDLERPIDNVVELSDYSQADDDYPIVGTSLTIVPVSNGRENFITGHRIPLELFPKETLRRIELIPDELVAPNEPNTPATTTSPSSSTTTPSPAPKFSPDNSYVESRSFRLEPSLTAETDSQFESTVDKFVPDY